MIRSVRRGFFINDHDFNWRVKNLLFILWPFGTFIYSLRCLQSKSSRWIFFLTCMAFGLCIECKNDTFDMSRITDIFYSYQNMDFRGLKNIFVDFYKYIFQSSEIHILIRIEYGFQRIEKYIC